MGAMGLKVGWSTRELAEIAGTTLKTVRHYHRIGLLEEPERAANGYKKYRIKHLIRLLRIRRLADLGVPLSEIDAVEESAEGAEQTLRALDAELAAGIERQQRMREELATILRHDNLDDLRPGFDPRSAGRSGTDRDFLLLWSQVVSPEVLDELRLSYEEPQSEAERLFNELPPDASEEERQRIATLFVPEVRRSRERFPRLREFGEQDPAKGDPQAWSVILQSLVELYSPAQIDVLQRANTMSQDLDGNPSAGPGAAG
jgi:DNA-binding transcriptional MerR regulator